MQSLKISLVFKLFLSFYKSAHMTVSQTYPTPAHPPYNSALPAIPWCIVLDSYLP